MGFLKRFLSLGSKKNRKKQDRMQRELPLLPNNSQSVGHKSGDDEAAVSRLLRSSSAHFSVVSQADYNALPPLPHPINSVNSRSTPTLLTPSFTGQSKSSYTVTVHGREQLSSTEFPNANPPIEQTPARKRLSGGIGTSKSEKRRSAAEGKLPRRRHTSVDPTKVPFTPRDANRLSRLRQDPSVVSLLNMYDDHGRIDDKAFSNTPTTSHTLSRLVTEQAAKEEKREKRRRRNSTLRELLNPSGLDDGNTGSDISWAERLMSGDNTSSSSLSTESSLPLETPIITDFPDGMDPNAGFVHGMDIRKRVTTDFDLSFDSVSTNDNLPAISSMEVELGSLVGNETIGSIGAESEGNRTLGRADQSGDILSPVIVRSPSKRASQVFGFLSGKNSHTKQSDVPPVPPLPTNLQGASILPPQPTAWQSIHGVVDSARPPSVPVTVAQTADQTQPEIPKIKVNNTSLETEGEASVSILSADVDAPIFMTSAPSTPRRLAELALPPAPTPVVIQPLNPMPPRQKARSTGAAEVLKDSEKRKMTRARMSVGPGDVGHRVIENAPPRHVKGPRALPQPPATKRSALGELTNSLSKRPQSILKGTKPNHENHSQPIEAFDARALSRTGSKSAQGISNYCADEAMQARYSQSVTPSTPVKRFQGAIAPSPPSSSELSPTAKQMMQEARIRRTASGRPQGAYRSHR